MYVRMYVCMYVCMSHNQIIRLNEKAKLIENSLRIELGTFGVEVQYTSHLKIWQTKQRS